MAALGHGSVRGLRGGDGERIIYASFTNQLVVIARPVRPYQRQILVMTWSDLRQSPRVLIASLTASVLTGLALFSAGKGPQIVPVGLHDKRKLPSIIAQRIMFCDDGSRADIDFLDDGLGMAVTLLPDGKTEVLRARATGREFRGATMRAMVAGGSIALMRATGPVRICHRTAEEG